MQHSTCKQGAARLARRTATTVTGTCAAQHWCMSLIRKFMKLFGLQAVPSWKDFVSCMLNFDQDLRLNVQYFINFHLKIMYVKNYILLHLFNF